jgi:hypothetical protein
MYRETGKTEKGSKGLVVVVGRGSQYGLWLFADFSKKTKRIKDGAESVLLYLDIHLDLNIIYS